MIEVTVTPTNITPLTQAMRQTRLTTFGMMVQEFRNSAPEISDIVTRLTPIGATGQLRQLTGAEIHIQDSLQQVSLVISQPAQHPRTGYIYMPAVSGPPIPGGGRAAGRRPPYQDLIPWVRAKMAVPDRRVRRVAYLLARKIGRQGTTGNPYYEQALQDSMVIVQRMANNLGRQITARLLRSR